MARTGHREPCLKGHEGLATKDTKNTKKNFVIFVIFVAKIFVAFVAQDRSLSYRRPSFAACATAADRDGTSSFDNVLATWRCTVCSLMQRRSAMA